MISFVALRGNPARLEIASVLRGLPVPHPFLPRIVSDLFIKGLLSFSSCAFSIEG